MRIIKKETQQGKSMLRRANNFEGIGLEDVYGNFSHEKFYTWRDCLEKCNKEHGKNFHICSHNTFQYSVAWETSEGVRIETASNSYLVC